MAEVMQHFYQMGFTICLSLIQTSRAYMPSAGLTIRKSLVSSLVTYFICSLQLKVYIMYELAGKYMQIPIKFNFISGKQNHRVFVTFR